MRAVGQGAEGVALEVDGVGGGCVVRVLDGDAERAVRDDRAWRVRAIVDCDVPRAYGSARVGEVDENVPVRLRDWEPPRQRGIVGRVERVRGDAAGWLLRRAVDPESVSFDGVPHERERPI